MKLSFWQKAHIFWQVLNDRQTPARYKLIAIALVLYVIAPLDIIPEAMPVIGLADDLLLVAMGIQYIWKKTSAIRRELKKV